MAPFKLFLSPRHKFAWSPELEAAFQTSKKSIIEAIREGVEILNLKRCTCLCPNWSSRGIGYFLLQQHCAAPLQYPIAARVDGRSPLRAHSSSPLKSSDTQLLKEKPLQWRGLLSKHNISPKDVTISSSLLTTKLLVKISGNRTLDEISNSGFFRLKQRTLPWHFDIVHRNRQCNQTTDATSRHPSPSGSVKDFTLGTPSNPNMAELALMATICSHAEKATIIHWSLIADATAQDKSLSHILTLLETQGNIDSSDPALAGLCLFINLFTRRCTDVQRPCCGTRIPLPQCPTASSLSPPGSLYNGTTHKGYCLLAWYVAFKRQETDMPNATAMRHHKQPHHQNPPHPHPLHLTKSLLTSLITVATTT